MGGCRAAIRRRGACVPSEVAIWFRVYGGWRELGLGSLRCGSLGGGSLGGGSLGGGSLERRAQGSPGIGAPKCQQFAANPKHRLGLRVCAAIRSGGKTVLLARKGFSKEWPALWGKMRRMARPK